MKKFLFYVLFAATALVSCEKSVLTTDDAGTTGEVATISVCTQTEASTRALADYITDETVEMKYYLEVYRENSLGVTERYLRLDPTDDGLFSVQLVKDQVFTLVAWADYDKGFYNTDNLNAVSINKDVYGINDIYRDAYAGKENITLTENESIVMTISRPFSRVNVYTNDWAAINPNDTHPDVVPASVGITYTDGIYSTYNVLTEDATDDKLSLDEVKADLVMYQDGSTIVDGDLSADYLFAKGGEAVISFDQVYYNTAGEKITDYPFTNIPIKKNYQTNISGSIITNTGDLTITVDKEWYEPSLLVFTDEDGAQTVITEIKEGDDIDVTLNMKIEGDCTLIFPNLYNIEDLPEVRITVAEEIAEGATLTLDSNGARSIQFNGTVYVTFEKDSEGDAIITLNNCQVFVSGPGSVDNITISATDVEDELLVTGEGSTIYSGFSANIGCAGSYGGLRNYGTLGSLAGNSKEVYIAIGEGSDRPDMTLEQAFTTYVTNSKGSYAGVIYDGAIYTTMPE